MESKKPTEQEQIKRLEEQCFHLSSALSQTCIFLSQAYAKIEEQDKHIAELILVKTK
jgi:hypothetical protein